MPFWRRLNGRLKSTWPSIGRQSVGNLLRVRREPSGRDRHPNGLRLGNPRLRAKPRARSGIAGAARSAPHGSPEIAENRAQLLAFALQIGEPFFGFGLLEKQHQTFSLLPADRDMAQDHDPFSG